MLLRLGRTLCRHAISVVVISVAVVVLPASDGGAHDRGYYHTHASGSHWGPGLSHDEIGEPGTCATRGCRPMIPELLEFVIGTYKMYDAQAEVPSIDEIPLPEVHFIRRSALTKKVCPEVECDAIGWFPNKGEIIYLTTDQDVENDLQARSILVHELVHYVQHMMGSPSGASRCETWKAREMQAYGIQYHWLRVNRVHVGTPSYNVRLAGYSRMKCEDGDG